MAVRYRYSVSTNGFYPSSINYPNPPEDLVEITEEQYQYFQSQLILGNKKIIDVNGNLTIADDPPPPATWDDIRAKRSIILKDTDYTQMPDWPGDKALWAKYRQALRDITTTFSDPNEVVWPKAPNA